MANGKEMYQQVEVDIIRFDNQEDIITTSAIGGGIKPPETNRNNRIININNKYEGMLKLISQSIGTTEHWTLGSNYISYNVKDPFDDILMDYCIHDKRFMLIGRNSKGKTETAEWTNVDIVQGIMTLTNTGLAGESKEKNVKKQRLALCLHEYKNGHKTYVTNAKEAKAFYNYYSEWYRNKVSHQ